MWSWTTVSLMCKTRPIADVGSYFILSPSVSRRCKCVYSCVGGMVCFLGVFLLALSQRWYQCSFFLLFVCFLFLEEDRYDSYSRMILKYFLAEGVVCRHELFVSAVQESPDDILQVWPCGLRHLKILHLLSFLYTEQSLLCTPWFTRYSRHTAFLKKCQGQWGASERSRAAWLQHCWDVSRCAVLWRGPLPQKLTVTHHMGGRSFYYWLIVGGVTASPSFYISKPY